MMKKKCQSICETKMQIIAIEGLNRAGKRTAMTVLYDYFTSKGLKVAQMHFPNYGTPIGALIDRWLRGEMLADEKTFELLQAADKQQAQIAIQECERRGVDILLINRYVHTEWAYGAYEHDDRWLAELTQHMRLPDAVLYLDIEPEVSMHRRGKYDDHEDYDADIERLCYTKNEYFCLFEEKKEAIDTHVIDANQPPLVVKAQVLMKAAEWLAQYTGASVQKEDLFAHITEEEATMLRYWSRSIIQEKKDRSIPVRNGTEG